MELGFEITLRSPTRCASSTIERGTHDGVAHASFRMATWNVVNKVVSYMLGFGLAPSNAKVFPHTHACVFSGGRLREDISQANKKHHGISSVAEDLP